MDKLTLRLSHLNAQMLATRLEDTIGVGVDEKSKPQRLLMWLWVECFMKLKAKTIYPYKNEKAYTFSFPQAIAFEALLEKWLKFDETSQDERTLYRSNVYRSIISEIDQKTA